MKKNIGVIGLGKMGNPMAQFLIQTGYNVFGYDKAETSQAIFKNNGGTNSSFRKILDNTNTIILMLPNSTVVSGVINDLCYHMDKCKKDLTIIDMSTSYPMDTINNQKKLKRLGVDLLDAPVSGGVKKASTGSLTIMVGGDAEVYKKKKDLLNVLGEKVVHVGKPGSGHVIKSLNNFLSAAHMLATCEAVQLLSSYNIDPEMGVHVFNESSGKSFSTSYKFPNFILNETYNSGFSLALLNKDITIANELFNSANANSASMEALLTTYSRALESLGNEADHTEIFRYIAASMIKGEEKNHVQ